MKIERESFIGCYRCYNRKKDCKCQLSDFHRVYKRNFNYWKFELVNKACGKEIMTSRTNKDDAVHCGDVTFSDILLCEDCKEKYPITQQGEEK